MELSGYRLPLTVPALRDVCRKYKPCIVFLIETKNKRSRMEKIRKKMNFSSFEYVDPVGKSGGLALWWNKDVDVIVLAKSKNMIDIIVQFQKPKLFTRATWVWGPNDFDDRQILWDKLVGLSGNIGGPWFVGGDFNEMASHLDKDGGLPTEPRRIKTFRSMMDACKLRSIATEGIPFTWSNKRGDEQAVRERIDRFLGNSEWLFACPKSLVNQLPIVGSDHSPLILQVVFQDNLAKRPFKFELIWAMEVECEEVVKDGWKERVSGSLCFKLVKKLRICKGKLINWSSKLFPNVVKEAERILKKMEEIQKGSQTAENLEELLSLSKELEVCWKREEKFWFQRSMIQWLLWGDKNSRFFHYKTLQRRQRNRVSRLLNDDDVWVEEETELGSLFEEYFKDLFKTSGPRDLTKVLEHVPQLVNDDMNQVLTREVTEEEVKKAVFSIGGLKAPGPDGYNALFYQKYWDTVGEDVTKAVQIFFHSGCMFRELNSTDIVLIPKVKVPEKVSQFRPISLCNVSNKIISKILVLRLKTFLPNIITENQAAFISQRLIQDNIIVAHETFHYLKRKKKGKVGELCLKLDMNKAYDRLSYPKSVQAHYKYR